jgi:hypothetical protein
MLGEFSRLAMLGGFTHLAMLGAFKAFKAVRGFH